MAYATWACGLVVRRALPNAVGGKRVAALIDDLVRRLASEPWPSAAAKASAGLRRRTVGVAQKFGHDIVRRPATRLGDALEPARVLAFDADEDS